MATSYEIIFDGFKKKLRGDKKFFNYKNLNDDEIQELVKDHSINLLNQSIGMIYVYGNPSFNFYDKDDKLQQFNGDLVAQEIPLIINIMYQKYMEEDKNKLGCRELTFKSSELNVLSPANERDSYLKMVKDLKTDNEYAIIDYLNRDRITWKLRVSRMG